MFSLDNLITRNEINIALIGPVSAGKSTILNTLFVEHYSDMKIKRTTMLPQVYKETEREDQYCNKDEIKQKNELNDKKYIESTENGVKLTFEELRELEYFVPKIYDLVDLEKNIYLNVYDIPGLNDSRTNEVYFKYLDENFYKFDIIIFVIDIKSAMNTSDEMNILKLIIDNAKKVYDKYKKMMYLLTVVNKCDNMFLDDDEVKLEPEFEEMYHQASKIIQLKINEIFKELRHKIIPVSFEDAYIYRIYKKYPNIELDVKYMNKFGTNEFGKSKWNTMNINDKKKAMKQILNSGDFNERMKLCGFLMFKDALKNILSVENQYVFLLNAIKFKIYKIISTEYTNFDIKNIIDQLNIQINLANDLYINMNMKKSKTKNIVNNVQLAKYIIDDTIMPFIMQYKDIVRQYLNDNVINNDEDIIKYQNIKDSLEWLKNVNILYVKILDEYVEKTTVALNQYIETNSIIPTNEISKLNYYINIIIKNKYTKWFKLLMSAYRKNTNILQMNTNELVGHIIECTKQYNLDIDQKFAMIYILLTNIYTNNGKYISSDPTKIAMRCFLVKKLFNNMEFLCFHKRMTHFTFIVEYKLQTTISQANIQSLNYDDVDLTVENMLLAIIIEKSK